MLSPGVNMLKQFANVDCSYDLTPDELAAKVSLVDALIVRSATKVSHISTACASHACMLRVGVGGSGHLHTSRGRSGQTCAGCTCSIGAC